MAFLVALHLIRRDEARRRSNPSKESFFGRLGEEKQILRAFGPQDDSSPLLIAKKEERKKTPSGRDYEPPL